MSKKPNNAIVQLIDQLPGGQQGEGARTIHRAYDTAREAHGSRRRDTGEFYLEHDLAVAQTVASVIFDVGSAAAGILHDTLDDHTPLSATDIQARFGADITQLVTGLQRLSPYAMLEPNHGAGTDLAMQRAILSIVENDVRIVLVAMADTLQDLRKAKDLSPERQQSIATAGMRLYAPLANRLGIWGFKWELEDLSFRYLEPERYREISAYLNERRAERSRGVAQAVEQLQARLEDAGIQASVSGRPKHIYSIYRKMLRKAVDVSSIYDLRAIRVILKSPDKSHCYQVLGIVHDAWQPVPGEFDDYIARPKENGYQSLHTAVFGPDGKALEVQIRTQQMHEQAERGIAAHWLYKESSRQSQNEMRQVESLRTLLHAYREEGRQPVDAVELAAEAMGDRIFVFTPKGDVFDLPQDSTPIDFAYQIHTQVGHRCRGAKVNGKMVSLDYKLKSGEQVEIITASRGGPSRDWMNENLGYTASARTRSRIRQWFRQQERDQNVNQGREVVLRELKRLGLLDVYQVADIAGALRFKDENEFLAQVGFGDIQTAQIAGAIASLQQKLRQDDELRPLLRKQPKSRGLTVTGVAGLHTKMARCCNPIPPEPIGGYVTRGHGVTIHRADCKQFLGISERSRIIDVAWGMEEETYEIPIIVKAYRRPGLVEEIANILRGQRLELINTKTVTANSITTIYLSVGVASLEQLNWLLQKLETLPNVLEAQRQRWSD